MLVEGEAFAEGFEGFFEHFHGLHLEFHGFHHGLLLGVGDHGLSFAMVKKSKLEAGFEKKVGPVNRCEFSGLGIKVDEELELVFGFEFEVGLGALEFHSFVVVADAALGVGEVFVLELFFDSFWEIVDGCGGVGDRAVTVEDGVGPFDPGGGPLGIMGEGAEVVLVGVEKDYHGVAGDIELGGEGASGIATFLVDPGAGEVDENGDDLRFGPVLIDFVGEDFLFESDGELGPVGAGEDDGEGKLFFPGFLESEVEISVLCSFECGGENEGEHD